MAEKFVLKLQVYAHQLLHNPRKFINFAPEMSFERTAHSIQIMRRVMRQARFHALDIASRQWTL